jgi:hypothetical protein
MIGDIPSPSPLAGFILVKAISKAKIHHQIRLD